MSTLDVGYTNKNNQKNLGYRGISETHYNQRFFEMECLNCGHRYMANGCDVWLRKCPVCQPKTKKRKNGAEKTGVENLQTLCSKCNPGKSDMRKQRKETGK